MGPFFYLPCEDAAPNEIRICRLHIITPVIWSVFFPEKSFAAHGAEKLYNNIWFIFPQLGIMPKKQFPFCKLRAIMREVSLWLVAFFCE